MTDIHPSAVVSPEAELGRDVVIGPFCHVESDTVIGEGCRLAGHAVIKQGTALGRENVVHEGAVIGGVPQHVSPPQCIGRLAIGDGNTIREHVTIHRGLSEEKVTVIGNGNFIMIGAHVAHDCRVGNQAIICNDVLLAGHVEIGDRAFVSGTVGIHQFTRVGQYAMVGGQARVIKDIPPYVTVDGATTLVVGLNLIGLRRAGFDRADIRQLKDAYRVVYRAGLKWTEVLERLETDFSTGPAAAFHEFFSGGTRGFTQERRLPRRAALKLHQPEDEGQTLAKKAS